MFINKNIELIIIYIIIGGYLNKYRCPCNTKDILYGFRNHILLYMFLGFFYNYFISLQFIGIYGNYFLYI